MHRGLQIIPYFPGCATFWSNAEHFDAIIDNLCFIISNNFGMIEPFEEKIIHGFMLWQG